MKKLTIRITLAFAGILLFQNAFAQEMKPVGVPHSWKNENTLIFSQMNKDKRVFFEYDILTGIKNECEMPKAAAVPIAAVKGGDIYFTSSDNKETRITATPQEEKNPTLSPDNSMIAFTRDNNLYTVRIDGTGEKQYTKDGSDLILNGWASWVYYEEILGRPTRYKAFWWSPDSKTIAFFRFDDTKVPMFPIYDSKGQHGSITETRYPKAGDPNPEVRIGFASTENGKTVWADFDPAIDQYFGTPFWNDNGNTLLVQWMDREQSNLVFYSVDKNTGLKSEVYKEHQATWLDWMEEIRFGKDGFYFVRDFELWEQIYYQSYDGKVLNRLTEGKNWGIKLIGFDEISRTIHFTSRRETSVRNDIYKLVWDKKMAKKSTVRLSSGDYNYSMVVLSPDKKHFAAVVSNLSTPSRLVFLADGKSKAVKPSELKTISDTAEGISLSEMPVAQMIYITTPDGYTLPGTVIWPEKMDKSKKYPVIVSMYGGPNSGTIMDSWRNPSADTKLWYKEGVIQVGIDHRASGHCGKEGMNFIHRNLGAQEIKDYILWAQHLVTLPNVDKDKIGITGFSYGGSMTVLALTEGAEYYRFGIAGGGVYDWKLYDSHYTERFMDSPQTNNEGYTSSSILGKVSKYRSETGSRLYLTHGTGDDNVHMQNTMQLIDALQKAGKQFDLMFYPGGMHGYRGYQAAHDTEAERAFWRRHLLNK
jgi:dipeptidyl-peptidase-4